LLLIGAERLVAEFLPVRRRAQNDHGFHAKNVDSIVNEQPRAVKAIIGLSLI
jgi:hypothetical protein